MIPIATEIGLIVRNRRLLAQLVLRELRARNAGSALGLAWLYLQPLGLLAAYYFLFETVFGLRLGPDAPAVRMGIYLLVGMIAWLAFSDALSRSMASLVEAGGVLTKHALPPGLFPARAALASACVYAPFFLALALLALIRHGPAFVLFALAGVFILQWLLVFVLGYLLALLVAAMRDVQQVAGFVLSIALFCSPVLYPLSILPEGLSWLPWLNPMTPFVLGWQEVVFAGRWPSATLWLAMLAWCAAFGVLLSAFLARAREQVVDWL